MAIDMSDVINDTDLLTPTLIQCYHQQRITGDNGRTVITLVGFTLYATVAPAGARQLQRLAEADRVAGAITLWTSTELQPIAEGLAADIVVWKNQQYLVQFVDDFSTNGFYAATCTLTTTIGPVPGTYPG